MSAQGSSESSLNTGTFARVRAHSFTIGYTDLLVILGHRQTADFNRDLRMRSRDVCLGPHMRRSHWGDRGRRAWAPSTPLPPYGVPTSGGPLAWP
jgi:hypothetical protein